MRDGPIRRALKAVARWKYGFELRVWRGLERRRGRLRFDLAGECRSCARCCEEPTIPVRWYLWLLRSLEERELPPEQFEELKRKMFLV